MSKRESSSAFDYAFAFLARFYGWTHEDILKLTTRQFFMYYRMARQLQAEEQIRLLQATLAPRLSNDSLGRTLRHYQSVIEDNVTSGNDAVEASWKHLRLRKKVGI